MREPLALFQDFKTSWIVGKFERKCFYLYVRYAGLTNEDVGFISSKKRKLFYMVAFRVEWFVKCNLSTSDIYLLWIHKIFYFLPARLS